MRKDIKITEKNQYRINVKITGVNDITDYIAYGAASHLGCKNHVIQFDCQPSESGFTVTIPSLSAGVHQYEVYGKRISSNVEFLLLEGRIEVRNRLSDGGSISNNNNQINVDVTLENGEINLDVNMTEGREGPQGERGADGQDGRDGQDGAQGEKGDKGDKGDKGEPFTFSDFTSEQLAALKGEKGDKGDKGDPGTGGSVDFILTDPSTSNNSLPTITNGKAGYTENNLLVGHNTSAVGIGNTVIGVGANTQPSISYYMDDGCVVVGHSASARGYGSISIGVISQANEAGSISIGNSARTNTNEGLALGDNAENNGFGITIGKSAWASSYAVAIGYQSIADNNAVAIGNYATAYDGEISLKSGSVEVRFTTDGMTLNGEPYGGGSGSSGGSEYDVRKAVLKSIQYDNKYSGVDMILHRNNCNSEWVDKDGYSGTWYEYYNDLTPSGEWLYSFSCADCDNVFYECPWLIKFAAKLENCTSVREGFRMCYNLESFYTPSKLRVCYFTFENCTKLKEFEADLSELQDASYMFGNDSSNCTSLNVESIEHIANSINSYTAEIHIGISNTLQNDYGDGEYQRCQTALQKIRDKGWTVYEIYSQNY